MRYNDTGNYVTYLYNAENALAELSYREANNNLIPDEVSWDLPQIDSRLFYYHGIVKEVSCISGYYDSDIIYFAVSE